MIESVGYTDDGQVWIKIPVQINGQQPATGVMVITPTHAKEVGKCLMDAAEQAEKKLGVTHV